MTVRERTLRANLVPDSIRVPVERQVARAMRLDPIVQRVLRGLPPPDLGRARRELAASTLLLSEAMAPEVHTLLRVVRQVLDVPNAVEVYQGAGTEDAGINAAVMYTAEDPILLLVQGRLLTNLDDEGKLVVLGHELGHYLAHGPRWPQTDMARVAYEVQRGVPVEHLHRLASVLGMAMELTADRLGLLVAQDLDALLRVQMVTTSGLPVDAVPWSARAYLEQCRELMEKTLEAGEGAVGASHPEHSLRSYAAWLFVETDAFRDLTGEGPGSRRLEEVDELLGRLIRPLLSPPAEGPGPRAPAAPGPRRVIHTTSSSEAWEEAGQGVRSVLEGVGDALGRASRKVAPGLERLKTATAEGVARVLDRSGGKPARPSGRRGAFDGAEQDPGGDPDPLADDDRALLDRFAELERREKVRATRPDPAPADADEKALLDRLAALDRKMREGK